MNRAELKAKAKQSLKGNYGTAILVLILMGVVAAVPSLIGVILQGATAQNGSEGGMTAVSILTLLVSLFVSSFLTIGATSFYLKLSRNQKVEYNELFSKTSLWLTCLIAMILMGVFTSLWSLLLFIPGIIASYSYRQTLNIIADNPKIGGLEAITRSKNLMKGRKMDLFVLDLSFIGWIILAPFTFGLLYLWLTPYMNTTYANFYNSLVEGSKKQRK